MPVEMTEKNAFIVTEFVAR